MTGSSRDIKFGLLSSIGNTLKDILDPKHVIKLIKDFVVMAASILLPPLLNPVSFIPSCMVI